MFKIQTKEEFAPHLQKANRTSSRGSHCFENCKRNYELEEWEEDAGNKYCSVDLREWWPYSLNPCDLFPNEPICDV